MGLTNAREEQLKRMPKIETRMRRSNDGKYFIVETTFTEIKPANYIKKILETDEEVLFAEA